MDDKIAELSELERNAAAGLLRAADDDELLVGVVAELVDSLRQVSENDELWSELEEGSNPDLARERSAELLLVDWEALLERSGVEDAAETAGELMHALAKVPEEPETWSQVKDQILSLIDRLEGDLQDPQPAEDKGWWRGLRDRAAYGVSALRRVRAGAVSMGAIKSVGDAGAPMLAGGVLGSPLGPPGSIIGAGVFGLAWLTGQDLRRAWRDEREGRIGRRLETLFSDLQLQPATVSNRVSEIAVIEEIVEMGGLDRYAEKAASILDTLRAWGTHLGARLASAWPFVAAHLGAAGVRDLESIATGLVELRGTLRQGCLRLEEGAADLLASTLHQARAALDGIVWKLDQLRHLLAAKGFTAHG